MSVYPRTAEKKRIMQEYRMRHEEMTSVALNRPRPLSPKAQLEQEKRIRREIANSNERRRMQSINAGFQSLKTLLPHHAGEKLSKAAILQQTSEYISSLERDKTTVMAENDRLRQQLMNINNTLNSINAAVAEESPPPKRKKRDTESSDEGIGLCEESTQLDEMRKKLLDIQLHFDQEKRMRLKFEDRSRALEAKLQKLSSHVLDKETVLSLNEADEKPSQPLFNSSMSRRNLETIVEAIRHLEGDRVGSLEEQHSGNMSQFGAVDCITAPPAHQHGSAVVYNSSGGGRGVVSITEQQQRQKKLCGVTGEVVALSAVIGQGKESCVKMGGSGGGGGGDEDKENCRSKDELGTTPLSSPINDDGDGSDDIEEDDDDGDDISDDNNDDDDDDVINEDADDDNDDGGDDCNDDCVDDDDDDNNSELLSPVDFSTTGQHHHNNNNNNNNGHKNNTPVFSSTVITTTTTTTASTNLSIINNNNHNNNKNTSSFSIPPSSLPVPSTTLSSTLSSSSSSTTSSSSLLTAAASKTPKPTLQQQQQQQHHHNQQQMLHPALSAVATSGAAAAAADTTPPPSAHSPVLVATTAAPPIVPAAHHHHHHQQQQTQQHRQQLQQQQRHHHHHHHHHHQQDQQQQQHHHQQHQVLASDCTSVVKANLTSSCFSPTPTPTNYPTASTLLHRAPPYTINQIYQRPGVIVHKS